MSEQKPLPKTPITQDELLRTNIAMLVLTTIYILSRATIHGTKRKTFELPDIFIYFAYILYIALWTCYVIVIPPMFRVYAVIGLETAPYPTMMQDAAIMLRLITAGQMCFYTLLLAAKLSLLTLYWKLLVGLPNVYQKVWWGIVCFCILSWLGSVFSSLFTCDNLVEKYQQGKCGGTPDEQRRIIFSLYFSYAVDITTDLAIMLLPIRLTWHLQMAKVQKVGIFILFGSGWICIAFATLRVVKLGVDGRGKTTTPEPKWMLLWTVLECSVAIMIGCSPVFAVFIRKRLSSSKRASYNAQGYIKQATTSSDIKMKNMASMAKPDDMDRYWADAEGSQEELARNAGDIVVGTTAHQDDKRLYTNGASVTPCEKTRL